MTQAHVAEELEYREAGPSVPWGDAAARTFQVAAGPPVVPFVQLAGSCPVCGHGMEQPEYLDQITGAAGTGEKGLAPQTAVPARVDDDLDMQCDCDVTHPGSNGKRGCGRRWRIHLEWTAQAHAITSPVDATGGDFDALARRLGLARGELQRVRNAADKWRTALAGLFTLATGLLVIKGRDSIDTLAPWAKTATGVLAAAGLALAIFGGIRAMRAAFGKPELKPLFTEAGRRIDERVHERADAVAARSDLRTARVATMLSLVALGAAIATTWYAPEDRDGANLVRVVRADGSLVCGSLLASENGQVAVKRTDTDELERIALTSVTSLRVVDDCTPTPP